MGVEQAGRAVGKFASQLLKKAGSTKPARTLKDLSDSWAAKGVDNWIHERNGVISLDKIVVPKHLREQGVGTQFMDDLISYADEAGYRIGTSPSSDFGGNKSRLTKFYSRYGFKKNKQDFDVSESMVRQPGKSSDALDSGHAARMERAKAQGFDTQRKLYHGSPRNDIKKLNLGPHDETAIDSVSLTPDPSYANEYAVGGYGRHHQREFFLDDAGKMQPYDDIGDPGAAPTIYPVYVRGKTIDFSEAVDLYESKHGANSFMDASPEDFARSMKEEGVTGVEMFGNEVAMLDPTAVRSVNAQFDPANVGKSNIMGQADPRLLAGVATGTAVGGAAITHNAKADMQNSIEKANDLERLLELYTQKGDKQGQLEVLRLMDQMSNEVQAQPDSFLKNVMDVAGEGAAGFNRTVLGGLDFMANAANVIPQALGSDKRLPRLMAGGEALGATQGNFMEPRPNETLGQQLTNPVNYVRAAGEALPIALGATQIPGRNLARPMEFIKEITGLGSASAAQPLKHGGIITGDMSEDVARQFAFGRGEGDTAAAGYTAEAGQIVKSRAGQKALRAGIDPAWVGDVATSSKQTKSRTGDMLTILEKGQRSKVYAKTHHPQQVVGQALEERLKVLMRVNRQSGGQIDKVARDLAGEIIDISPAKGNFLQNLAKEGITLDEAGEVVFKGFVDPRAKRIIKETMKMLENPGRVDAFDAHFLKRQIDRLVTFGKQPSGMGGPFEGVLKSLRRDIDGILDANFNTYRRVNDAYSQTIKVLDDIQSMAGKRVSLDSDNIASALGTMARKILSNYNTKVPIKELTDQMTALAKKFAPKQAGRFDDNIETLLAFESELRALFPDARPPNSFMAEIGQAAGQVASSVATQNPLDAARGAANLAAGTLKKSELKTIDAQLKAWRAMLSEAR